MWQRFLFRLRLIWTAFRWYTAERGFLGIALDFKLFMFQVDLFTLGSIIHVDFVTAWTELSVGLTLKFLPYGHVTTRRARLNAVRASLRRTERHVGPYLYPRQRRIS